MTAGLLDRSGRKGNWGRCLILWVCPADFELTIHWHFGFRVSGFGRGAWCLNKT